MTAKTQIKRPAGRPCPGTFGNAPVRGKLPDPRATDMLGTAIGEALSPGDTVLLSGTLGAGKSALARAAVRARLREPEAVVPSPTYTLVNVFDSPTGEIWHADLYRLGHPEEIEELGLADAFGRALTLVEWPDRLGALCPKKRLEISLAPEDLGRSVEIRAFGRDWRALLSAAEQVLGQAS
ncbi:MAG: tRNA (adenosine(37)-N6)-threonylcarbamoyltransferase complex ATPase subunit type 1 TsaE [Pseudomonadota bacterium]